jgi:transposase-like protein
MSKRSSKRRSSYEWEQLIASYQAGELTQREFCVHHGLAYSTFCYWRKQLRETKPTEHTAAPLIELPVISPQDTPTWRIELDLGQGVVIRIR